MALKDNRRTQVAYPEDMRTNLWPLCCGAAILSGFKNVGNKTDEELRAAIMEQVTNSIPDNQVYAGEQIRPGTLFVTLNGGQMGSPKIVKALTDCGFVQFAQGTDRNAQQGFFVRTANGNFKLLPGVTVTKAPEPVLVKAA